MVFREPEVPVLVACLAVHEDFLHTAFVGENC
jgi:hypothetical protein